MQRSSGVATYSEIEGLRGVGSLLVVLAHMVSMYHWPRALREHESPMFWAVGLMDVFFTVSGFFIARSLLRSSAQPDKPWVRSFLMKRALRIWPAYYVALALAVCASLTLPLHQSPHVMVWNRDFGYLAKTLFFVQNSEFYFGAARQSAGAIPTFQHSWSVALEEQFYLVIVVVMFLRAKFGLLRGSRLLVFALLLAPVSQIVRHFLPFEWIFIGRHDGFLLGIALACVEPKFGELRRRLPIIERHPGRLGTIAILASFVPVLPYLISHGYEHRLPKLLRIGPFEPSFAFSMFTLVILVVSAVDSSSVLLRPFRAALPRYLGKISYSVYLIHPMGLYVVWEALEHYELDRLWLFPLGLAAIFVLGTLSYKLVESPFMRIKLRATENGARPIALSPPT